MSDTTPVRPQFAHPAPVAADSDTVDACIVCGGTYLPSKLPGLFQCESCGFISADLSIPDEELSGLYGEDYFHGNEYLDYVAEADSLALNFRRRISMLQKLMPDMASAELFEIGCAYGYFLREIAPKVRKASGMDISGDAIRRAVTDQGVDAVEGNYLETDLGRQVDIITMWDTVEHLKRPDLFLEKAGHDLRPGGLVAVTTGDIGSLNARFQGKAWRMIHPPTHLHYFSVATMKKLLEAKGFEVIYVAHPGNSRRLRSVLYFLTALKGDKRGVYESLKGYRFFDLNFTVNLFDIMYVVARKR